MILALTLGVCAAVPLFDMSGPVCAPERLSIECGCSECLRWDSSSGAVSYTVQRTDMDGTLHVGFLPSVLDGDVTLAPSTFWCPAKHDDLLLGNKGTPDITPLEGRTYRYTVKACNDYGCSAYAPEVVYVAAPYATVQFRPPVKGN